MNWILRIIETRIRAAQPMSKRSERNLATVHQDLERVIRRAWRIRGDLDFTVICGHRGEKAQNTAFENGASRVRWPNSKHNRNPSLAVDVIPDPIPRTSDGWNTPEYLDKFQRLAEIIQRAAAIEGVTVKWGGTWGWDRPHWEIEEAQS